MLTLDQILNESRYADMDAPLRGCVVVEIV